MRPLDAVREFLRREGISGTSVCVALSGGADSVCLLVCLLAVRQEFDLRISAVHIQHGLRGEESRRDEVFCIKRCAAWNVPLKVIPVDVKKTAASQRISIETAARECRYAAFDALGCDYIATAHTASDQLETVLFRMARGTGLRGLCGIPPRRGRYLRPLLSCTRTEIEECLRENAISYVIDSSNLSDDYSRNFIRHNIVPPLRQLNPAVEQNLPHMVQNLRDDADFLSQAADAAYAKALQADGSLSGLQDLHPALQSRCIARFLKSSGLPSGFEAVTAAKALLTRGGQCDLDRSGRKLRFSRGVLFVEEPPPPIPKIRLQMGENSLFDGITVTAEIISRENAEKFASVHKKFTDFVLDYDIIREYVDLHCRKPGLRLLPVGRTHHVSIKKWLGEQVPPAKRQYIHFLSDADGLLWAEGLGADQRARVTDRTQSMLWLQVHPTDTNRT
ncbi:MAG: tRNA lysidine(34) synthetase TilS [Oscillospiraceae bacterium]|nr:tRNA lysidine(34) synthetase TilS [Oscillospiraceae bacterium]